MLINFIFLKVSWNILSTILASSDEENIVKLWKNDGSGKFAMISKISEEEDKDGEQII